jgi:hypothetical protein
MNQAVLVEFCCHSALPNPTFLIPPVAWKTLRRKVRAANLRRCRTAPSFGAGNFMLRCIAAPGKLPELVAVGLRDVCTWSGRRIRAGKDTAGLYDWLLDLAEDAGHGAQVRMIRRSR